MTNRLVGVASLMGMLTALWAVFVYAPTEVTMGIVQRIFYFHVSAGMMGYFAFFVVFVSGIAFLVTRDLRWDRVARCSAEIGVLFATVNIAMGILWAKPIWGIWWTWDARLTLQLLLWILFISYLMLGAYIADPLKRASLQAVFGILAFIDVPINYMAIRWWRTQHPSPVIAGGTDSGLDPDMYIAWMITIAAFMLLYAYLLGQRLAVERTREDVEYFEQLVHSQ